ncbi:Os03g0289350, partial [Oryza sativa Japonica Group]
LDELEPHEELDALELEPLVVEERHGADPRPQLRHRERRLPAEVVLAHVVLVHLHAEQRDLRDGQREHELLLPHGNPAVLHGFRLLHHRVRRNPGNAHL